MQLNGHQLEQFRNALLSAFPTSGSLAQMVRFKLNKNLNEIAGGQDHSEVIFKLLLWAESKGRLAELAIAAVKTNPNNPVLLEFVRQFQYLNVSSTLTRASHQFPEILHFDLNDPVRESIKELIGKQGIVGLAIPCRETMFLTNFTRRLHLALGRRNTELRPMFSLNPRFTSVKQSVENIRKSHELLSKSKKDVICPIRVEEIQTENSADSSNLIHEFWNQTQSAFQHDFEHRLILVLAGSEQCVFPKSAIPIPPPRFEKVDVFEWVGGITQTLDCHHIREEWTRRIVDRCGCDPRTQQLEVDLVYYYLDYTLSHLSESLHLPVEALLEQLY